MLTDYSNTPALKPTVLLRDLMKNVYRPSAWQPTPTLQTVAVERQTPRETSRAA
jgi:hypothetical protein